MWYWLLMGALLLPMLLFMKINQTKWFAASKLFLFIGLIGCLIFHSNVDGLSWALSFLALIFFALCNGVEELSPKYRKLQLSFFSLGCFFYSLDFWWQVDSISWAVPIAAFALVVVTFFLLLPLLDSFALPALFVAMMLWQLLWASGELWHINRDLLDMSGLIGTVLLSLAVLMWAIHYFRKPFKHSYGLIMCCYFTAHIFIIAPLVLK